MTETRRIDYTIAPDGKSITITGQTHRGEEFTPDGCWFKSPNGVSLRSVNFPCMSCDGVVYVRGLSHGDDNVPLRDSRQRIAEIADAFDAYNEAGKEEAKTAVEQLLAGHRKPLATVYVVRYPSSMIEMSGLLNEEWVFESRDAAFAHADKEGTLDVSVLAIDIAEVRTVERVYADGRDDKPPVATAAMQPPFEGPVEGLGMKIPKDAVAKCSDCRQVIGIDDCYCRSCGMQFLANDETDTLLSHLISDYAVPAHRPAMHARLRALVAGEKENNDA